MNTAQITSVCDVKYGINWYTKFRLLIRPCFPTLRNSALMDVIASLSEDNITQFAPLHFQIHHYCFEHDASKSKVLFAFWTGYFFVKIV